MCCINDISSFESRQPGRSAVAAGRDPQQLDAESGALDRRAIMQVLGAEISRSRRYGNPLSSLLIRYSDGGEGQLGTIKFTGTRRRVAERLWESLRWVDSLGALSRGEFLVVLPETGRRAAEHVLEKVRASLEALDLEDAHAELAYRLAATERAQEDNAQRLLARLHAELDARSGGVDD